MARFQEVRNGLLAEAALIGRHQDEATGPPQDVGQALKAAEVRGAGQADEDSSSAASIGCWRNSDFSQLSY
ncbi:MAG TPA: hypothetical protein VK165_19485 [Azonexus sp.]|nr:hypothetical protein [Azonexus sp.]